MLKPTQQYKVSKNTNKMNYLLSTCCLAFTCRSPSPPPRRCWTTPSRQTSWSTSTRAWRRSCCSGSSRPSTRSMTGSWPTPSTGCRTSCRPSTPTAPWRNRPSESQWKGLGSIPDVHSLPVNKLCTLRFSCVWCVYFKWNLMIYITYIYTFSSYSWSRYKIW